MYLLVALAVTVIVIALAWRGLGTRTDGETPTRPEPPRRPSRPMAPDDDPDFLHEIDRKLRDGKDKNESGGTEASA